MKDIFNRRQRFSLRKYSFGVASVLLGTALFAAHTAQADEEASGAMTSSACAVWAAKSAVPSKTEATPNEYLRNENRWRLLKMSFISSLPLYEIVSYRSRVYKNPILELMILLHSNILTIYGQVIKSTFLKKNQVVWQFSQQLLFVFCLYKCKTLDFIYFIPFSNFYFIFFSFLTFSCFSRKMLDLWEDLTHFIGWFSYFYSNFYLLITNHPIL